MGDHVPVTRTSTIGSANAETMRTVRSLSMIAALLACVAGGDPLVERVQPFLRAHCIECHAGAEPEGGLAIDVLLAKPPGDHREAWRAMRERVVQGTMPPKGRARPAAGDTDAFARAVDALAPAVELAATPLRRMTRYEYARTVRDLLGVDVDADDALPPDDVAAGFDNVAAALPTSDAWLERYVASAERAAALAVVIDAGSRTRRVGGRKLSGRSSSARGEHRVVVSQGAAGFDLDLPRAGEYVVRARAAGDQAGPDPCRMALSIGAERSRPIDVPGEPGHAVEYEAVVRAAGGRSRIAAEFLNDYYAPDAPEPGDRDRNLIVEWLEVEGPIDPPALSPFQRSELAPERTASAIVGRFAERAFRRPVDAREVAALLDLAPKSASREESVRVAISAVLASPSFLFRAGSGGGEPVTQHELAARTSYFLWSSCPDDDLLAYASAGSLASREGLRALAERMLDDPRASSLAESFAAQWLGLRALDRAQPDPRTFPGIDEELRTAMRAETEMLFDAVLRERRQARELLEAHFTFANERLAKHYGLAGVRGASMRRVPLEASSPRGGVLGHASIATVTSNPTRTNPSRRGKWILETLLDAAPPPPPPGVGVIDESSAAARAASLRERLEEHRADPACAACHARIDPLGFGLENLDGVGAWRERDGVHAIDAQGELGDGRRFRGPRELAALVAQDPAFVRALLERLFVYALGRPPGVADERELDDAARSLGTNATLRDCVLAIVTLPAFRRGV